MGTMMMITTSLCILMIFTLATSGHPIQPESISDNEVDTVGIPKESHDRRGFVTGHRIPLELFGKDTLRRIELLEDVEQPAAPARQYVDSDDIRSAPLPPLPPKHRPDILGGLTSESDTKYFETLTSFVPPPAFGFNDYF